jgi:hypothetical protein
MNVDVLHRLREAVAERGPGAYVLTVSNDGRPHAVYVNVVWSDGRIVAEVGNTTTANAKARPARHRRLLFVRRRPRHRRVKWRRPSPWS